MEALAEAGYEGLCVTSSPPTFDNQGVEVARIWSSARFSDKLPTREATAFWLIFSFLATLRCLRLCLVKDVGCLLSFSLGAAFPLLVARAVSRKPLVVFIRADEIEEQRLNGVAAHWRWIVKVLSRLTVMSSTQLVTVSQRLVEVMALRYGRAVLSKIEILPNDLPEHPSPSAPAKATVSRIIGRSGAFVVATSGCFEPAKNVSLLLEALARLNRPQAHLLLLGDGPELRSLRKKAQDLGVDGRVCFAGWRDDVPELVAGVEVFLLPSLSEGMSNALLEALSAGVPCLASDLPQHREVLRHSNLVFDPRDPDELASLLLRLMEETGYREQLELKSREAAAALEFDWNSEVVRIVQDLIEDKGPRSRRPQAIPR